DLEVPFERLPKKIQNILLHGSNELIRFQYKDENDRVFTKTDPFEGVLPNLERRYHETESEFVREELRKYIAVRTCDACGGARLNKAARNVFVTGKNLSDIAAWPVDKTKLFFEKLHLPGYRGEIAE